MKDDYGEHCEDLAGYGVGKGELSNYDGYESSLEPETESDNAPNETVEGYACAFIWDWQTWPRRCYQCGKLEKDHK